MLKAKPTHLTKNGRKTRRREVAATHKFETGEGALMIDNMGIQKGDPEEDDNRVAICTFTHDSKPPVALANEELTGVPPVTSGPAPESAASPLLPYYSVGWGVSLPFGQLLPQCCECDCNALITWSNRSGPDPKETGFVCLAHGLSDYSGIKLLRLAWTVNRRYRFISPEHEAALREFVA